MISSAPAECALGEKFELFGLDRAPQTVNGERKLAADRGDRAKKPLLVEKCALRRDKVSLYPDPPLADGGGEQFDTERGVFRDRLSRESRIQARKGRKNRLRAVEGKLAETRRNQPDIPHALTSAGENETDARLPASPLSLVTENDIPFSLHVPSSMTASLGALERR